MTKKSEEKPIISKTLYDNLRSSYTTMSKYWNGIMRVWNDITNPNMPYNQVSGNKTQMGETVPLEYRYPQYKNNDGLMYDENLNLVTSDGKVSEIKTTIDVESEIIHTLGNENNIRQSYKLLNDVVHKYIGTSVGFQKIEINQIGKNITVLNWESNKTYNKNDKVKYNNNLYVCISQHTSSSSFDETRFTKILKYTSDSSYNNENPYINNSFVEYNTLSDPQSLQQKDVITYDINDIKQINNDNIIKKSDYENITKVLDRIQTCLNKKNSWFDSKLCARQCQVSCQKTCQLACQGCNTKQCHNQKCGMH